MKKLERLACLYLTFLNTPAGLTFSAIRRAMPAAYSGEHETARRTFERDKKDLQRLGMDLQHYPDGAPLPDGRSAQGHTYIPLDPPRPLTGHELSAQEVHILAALLMSAIARDRHDQKERAGFLESARLKLLYRNPALLLERHSSELAVRLPADSEPRSRLLSRVHRALRRRRLLAIEYPEAAGGWKERLVEPRGLIAHRGRWCLVAYCRTAAGYRSFYVDRMRSAQVREDRIRSDPKFALSAFSLHPLALQMHEPVELQLRLTPGAEESFADFVSGAASAGTVRYRRDRELVRLETPNRRGLFQWMLQHPGAVAQLGPAEERLAYARTLAEMKHLNGGGPR